MVALHQAIFIGSIIVLLAGIALREVMYRADTRTMCRLHINDTQRYLRIKGYNVIYLYSEACIDSFVPPPHKLVPLRVTMNSSTSTSETIQQSGRILCDLVQYHYDDADETKKTTVRMIFSQRDGLFDGIIDTRGWSRALACPDSLQVIRITQ